MIRRLRIKFVCVIMVIVTLVMGGILGVAIHFTGKNMEDQSINMMRRIAAGPIQQGGPGAPSEAVRLPFFTVQISSRGELIAARGGYFDLSDREYIQQIVDEAMDLEGESGELKAHSLRYLKTSSPAGFEIIFSDTTTEAATLRNMVYSCLLIFFIAIVVFFGISILLSQWVIKPVAVAWDQQRRFVADASHELKTPLSVIMANAELMQSEESGEAERRTFSENILAVSYQMRYLVEKMLEMARVDDGAVKMRFAPVDFSQLIRDAVLSFQLLYEEKGLGLSCAVREGVFVKASEQHLYQVLDVLLDNALKYSSIPGTVRVELSGTGKSCILSVSGPGEEISGEDLKNIFKRFYRVDKSRAMNGSYGLGLSIAEAIISAHKGKIWAESREGTNTFFVRLPC